MRLNNKGFVTSALLYTLLILFISILLGILALFSNRKMVLDKIKKDVKEEISETTLPYTETILNGAYPQLKSDMIPVTIENNGTVKRADVRNEWYKYADKKWANAVVLIDNTSYKVGDTIPENKIKAYYVWIPRYKYQIFNDTTSSVSPQTINIVFESKTTTKSTSETNGEYLTHPAFTYGSEELSGFWVGKFETTGTASAPTIKPNVQSLRNQNVSTQYATSKNISTGSIMMKNDEWGAMAYLSHSTYGKNSQIRINNNSGYKTGCGASSENGSSTSSCTTSYGNASSYPQSTTGNITGIFDTSGGAHDRVMAVKAHSDGNPLSGQNSSANSGFNGPLGAPQTGDSSITSITNGVDFPNSKDYNLYNGSNYNNSCNGGKCYGDATRETSGWYSDLNLSIAAMYPWVYRGGDYQSTTGSGVFSTVMNNGAGAGGYSFRTVVR